MNENWLSEISRSLCRIKIFFGCPNDDEFHTILMEENIFGKKLSLLFLYTLINTIFDFSFFNLSRKEKKIMENVKNVKYCQIVQAMEFHKTMWMVVIFQVDTAISNSNKLIVHKILLITI